MSQSIAGNLAGNLQNRAGFAFFQATGAADRVTYQDVRHEFPVPGKTGNLGGTTGNSRDGHWGSMRCSKVRGAALKGIRYEAAKR